MEIKPETSNFIGGRLINNTWKSSKVPSTCQPTSNFGASSYFNNLNNAPLTTTATTTTATALPSFDVSHRKSTKVPDSNQKNYTAVFQAKNIEPLHCINHFMTSSLSPDEHRGNFTTASGGFMSPSSDVRSPFGSDCTLSSDFHLKNYHQSGNISSNGCGEGGGGGGVHGEYNNGLPPILPLVSPSTLKPEENHCENSILPVYFET